MYEAGKRQISFELKVLQFIRDRHLLDKPGRLVVAVSGGPDSVCLLYTLFKLKNTLDIDIHVAHLDHRLRGTASAEDAKYVSALARKLRLPFTIEERDVNEYKTKHHLSIEEAAREVRYEFLRHVVASTGALAVAVGHTRDDNVETILMHLIRGTGTRGIRGLRPVSQWLSPASPAGPGLTVLRPLLDITRAETLAYCRSQDLVPRIDNTNFSLSLLRNRIRLKLLPELRRYNPRIDDALLRMANIAADELDYLDGESNRLWRKIAVQTENAILIDRRKLLRLKPALQRQLLRLALEKTTGNLKDIETRHIEEMLETLKKQPGSAAALPDGLTLAVEYDRFLISRDPASSCPFPVLAPESKLNVPGETGIPGWLVTARILPLSATDGVATGATGTTIALPQKRESGSYAAPEKIRFSASFDFDKVGEEITVRPYRPGDRFHPLGLKHAKKVGRFMIDARIPRWWRDRVPVVSSPEHIIWVAGWRIDERSKITGNTKKVLLLEFRRMPYRVVDA